MRRMSCLRDAFPLRNSCRVLFHPFAKTAGPFCGERDGCSGPASTLYRAELTLPEFFKNFVIIQAVLHRCIGRDMVSHCHEKTGAGLSDIHTALYLVIDILPAAAKKNPGIRISDKGMGFPVFFRHIFHICGRLHHKAVYPAGGDIIDKFCIIPVGGENNFLSGFPQRCEQPFIIGKNKLPVPIGMGKSSRCPCDIVVHLHHRRSIFHTGLRFPRKPLHQSPWP